MKKIICSPGSYIQGSKEIKNLAEYYSQLGSKGAYLIVDKFIDKLYHPEIISSFVKDGIPYSLNDFGGECSHTEIDMHRRNLGNCDVVIGSSVENSLDI